MPIVDDGSLATNSDAAMWRTDHASACRYIEALLEERETWAPVIEAAIAARRTQHEYNTAVPFTNDREKAARRAYEANGLLAARIDAALKEGSSD